MNLYRRLIQAKQIDILDSRHLGGIPDRRNDGYVESSRGFAEVCVLPYRLCGHAFAMELPTSRSSLLEPWGP